MLVEPLLPRAWRKELDKQKIMKDDQDTDLYATSIGKKDMKQAAEEEGLALLTGTTSSNVKLRCTTTNFARFCAKREHLITSDKI